MGHDATQPRVRRSFYLGRHISLLLGSGRVRARSESARLDELASRYELLIRDVMPRRLELTTAELVLLAGLVNAADHRGPDLAMLLPAMVQQIGADLPSTDGVDTASLGYRLRSAKQAEVLALIDLAERLLAVNPEPSRDDASGILEVLRASQRHRGGTPG
ncbi:hypothetical protein [Rhodanobacter sp. FW106-PBR-R2A-1-13]|uniref:hypothetical protein n=1 Tax=Rhodanobacter sp. FW106-PBR-R2A-1-13 TaxID=3454845 RepID=UPI0034E424A5